ncbi:BJ4_G0005830.mRNA.1.CDS.1 [Saccharomyces cerevisiae]|nr:BJ4_G0005830.mRNA.1.CDS.1 [Saccharomyces cerevisiae]
MFTSQRQLRQNGSPMSSSRSSQHSSGTASPISDSPASNRSYGRDLRGLMGIDIPANEPAFNRANSSDTIYFRPKKIYKMEHEHPSRSTLVQLQTRSQPDDVASSQVNPEGGTDDLELGDPCGNQSLYTIGAEYVPDLDFTKLVNEWQKSTEDLYEFRSSATPQVQIKDSGKGNYELWSSPDAILTQNKLRRDSFSQENSDSLSPEDSILSRNLHSKVKPIPLPRNGQQIFTPLSNLEAERRSSYTTSSNNNSITQNNKFSFAKLKYSLPTQSSAVPASFDSNASSLNFLPTTTLSTLSELQISPNDMMDLIQKLPRNFLNLPYTQRKKVIIEHAPSHDYKAMMSLVKKFMLTSSRSNFSLAGFANNASVSQATANDDNINSRNTPNNSNDIYVNTRPLQRSRHGSIASQFLSSFSPSMTSIAKMNSNPLSGSAGGSARPDDKGMEILGHRLGKIIGFGAWGIIRECFDIETGVGRVIKIVKFKGHQNIKKHVLKEVAIWRTLKHNRILPLLDWKLDDNYAMYCLTERINDGTLYDLVISWDEFKRSKIPFAERCRLTIFLSLQLLSALKYMHSKRIVHGDIKLENCLLQKEGKKSDWKVFLCDFGMSCHFDEKHVYRNDTFDENLSSGNSHRKRKSIEQTNLIKYPTTNFLPDDRTNDFDASENLKYQFENRKHQPFTPKGMVSSSSHSLKHLNQPSSSSSSNLFHKPASQPQPQHRSPFHGRHKTTDFSNLEPEPSKYIGSLPYASPELLRYSDARRSKSVEMHIYDSPDSSQSEISAASSSSSNLSSLSSSTKASAVTNSGVTTSSPSGSSTDFPCIVSPLGPASDIWALGVMLYTMLVGKLPFNHEFEPRLRSLIKVGEFDRFSLAQVCKFDRKKNEGTIGQGLYDTVIGCLTIDLDKRWKLKRIEEVLQNEMNLSEAIHDNNGS